MIKVPKPEDDVYSEVIDGVKHIYLTKTLFVENDDRELDEVDNDYILKDGEEYEICFTPIIKAYAEYILVDDKIIRNPDYDDALPGTLWSNFYVLF